MDKETDPGRRPKPSDSVDTDPSKSIHFQEWKECRSSIARFDDKVLNLRKFGFSLLTLLLGSSGFLYAELIKDVNLNNGAVIGIYFAIMLLILGLFRMDRMYQVFLRGAVNRAKTLEDLPDLQMALSKKISELTGKCRTATWGVSLYILFCIANFLLVFGATMDFKSLEDFFRSFIIQWHIILIYVVVAVFIISLILLYHSRSKKGALAGDKTDKEMED